MTRRSRTGLRALCLLALAAAGAALAPVASAQDFVRLLSNQGFEGCGDGAKTPAASSPDRKDDFNFALNNENGSLRATFFADGWFSAQWRMDPVSTQPGNKTFTFTNRWTNEILAAWVGADGQPALGALAPGAQIPNRGPDGGATREPGPAELSWEVNAAGGTATLSQPGIQVDRGTNIWTLGVVNCKLTIIPMGNIEAQERWKIEVSEAAAPPPPEGGYVWLQKSGAQSALNIETGAPAVSDVQPGWFSAQWEMKTPAARSLNLGSAANGTPVIFINRWTGQALGADSAGYLAMVAPPTFDAQGAISSTNGVLQISAEGMPDGSKQILDAAGRKLSTDKDGKYGFGKSFTVGWKIESFHPGYVPPPPVEPYVRIAANDGRAINNETGAPQAGAIQPSWFSAMWVVEPMGGSRAEIVAYRNRWTNQYLGVVDGKLAMVDAAASINDPAAVTYSWQVTGGSPDASKKALTNLKSGKSLGTAPSGAALIDAPAYIWNVTDVQ